MSNLSIISKLLIQRLSLTGTDAETFLRRQTVESDKMIGRGGDSISSPGYNADPEGSAVLQQRYAAAGGGGSMADEYYYQQRHQQQ